MLLVLPCVRAVALVAYFCGLVAYFLVVKVAYGSIITIGVCVVYCVYLLACCLT